MKHALIRHKSFSAACAGMKLCFQLAAMLFILALLVFYISRLTPETLCSLFTGTPCKA